MKCKGYEKVCQEEKKGRSEYCQDCIDSKKYQVDKNRRIMIKKRLKAAKQPLNTIPGKPVMGWIGA